MARKFGIRVPGGRLLLCQEDRRYWFEYDGVISRDEAMRLVAEAEDTGLMGAMVVSGQRFSEFLARLPIDEEYGRTRDDAAAT